MAGGLNLLLRSAKGAGVAAAISVGLSASVAAEPMSLDELATKRRELEARLAHLEAIERLEKRISRLEKRQKVQALPSVTKANPAAASERVSAIPAVPPDLSDQQPAAYHLSSNTIMPPADVRYAHKEALRRDESSADSWTGLYWGAMFGGGIVKANAATAFSYRNDWVGGWGAGDGAGIVTSDSGRGALADLILGGNLHISPSVVFGVQLEGTLGDMNFDMSGTESVTYSYISSPDNHVTRDYRPLLHARWMTSALVRAGWLAKPSLLLYGAAGWTGAMVEYSRLTGNDDWYNPKGHFWANGWSFAGGAEYRISDNWSLRAEYRLTHFPTLTTHSNFYTVSTSSVITATSALTTTADFHTVRVGVSYLLPIGR